jgi:hypothetical protein
MQVGAHIIGIGAINRRGPIFKQIILLIVAEKVALTGRSHVLRTALSNRLN